ncbi:hypothetical protein RDI58_030186 [Solanum bulbocastanum]|uniref:DNA-directed RNA polymerase n=1 Tax=Solanum bulbocastanum TaxID=147425 RepID=A0AAN8SUI1_SOLBU
MGRKKALITSEMSKRKGRRGDVYSLKTVRDSHPGLSETDFHNYDRKSGAISKYQNAVFDLLDRAKGDADIHHPESLIELQKKIESLAYPYDSMKNIYQAAPLLHRNLVKSLLMPLVYGKTAYSMAENLYNELNKPLGLGKKECLELATHIEIFFKKRFPHIVNLMSLIRAVGWVVSASGAPVYYSTPMFTTVQDYMKSEAVNIWLYDRHSKKRRQVTLRVPTPERDRRKTTSAIFANFIHQKDAIIAFNMIKNVKKRGIPIYTVHDNFITTMDFAHAMGESYIEILLNSPHPMEYINSFLAINLFDEARTPGGLCQIDLDGCFAGVFYISAKLIVKTPIPR